MQWQVSAFEPVADGVFRAVAEPESVNIGLVVGSAGALLIDTGSSPAQGRALRVAATAVAGDVPLTHVVVTHAHADHLFGLAAFADLTTIAHRGLPRLLAAEPTTAEARRLGLDAGDLAAPDTTFGLATTVDLGDCHAEVVHFGRGHTDHDAVVIVPGRGVLFAGDLLESAAPPAAGPDAWPSEWARTLDGSLGTLRRSSVVVPGHGPVMTREEAFMQRAELAWYSGKAEELYDAGSPAAGAWSADGDWPWAREPTEAFLAAAMARLEASGRPRRRARTLPLLGR